jgi:hypothetical protein
MMARDAIAAREAAEMGQLDRRASTQKSLAGTGGFQLDPIAVPQGLSGGNQTGSWLAAGQAAGTERSSGGARALVEKKLSSITRGWITLEIAQQIRKWTLESCCEGGDGDPLSKNPATREFGQIWCGGAAGFFLKHDWILPCKELLLELWEKYAQRQLKLKRRVPRAFIAQLLTETAHRARRLDESFRWSLLSHADSALGGDTPEESTSRHWLYGAFGVSDIEKAAVERIASRCRRVAQKSGWTAPSGFAEEVFRLLAFDRPLGQALINRHAAIEEFPISRTYLSSLIQHLQRARKNAEKGRFLEDLAGYLFLLISGATPQRNVLDKARASEYDLVVFNHPVAGNGLSTRFGSSYLVECKNWNRPVDVAVVGYFLHRMRLTHCRFGVIFSRNGITQRERADAYADSLIRRSFHEDGSTCIVVTLEDIKALANGNLPTVSGLLLDRANRLQFGESTSGSA